MQILRVPRPHSPRLNKYLSLFCFSCSPNSLYLTSTRPCYRFRLQCHRRSRSPRRLLARLKAFSSSYTPAWRKTRQMRQNPVKDSDPSITQAKQLVKDILQGSLEDCSKSERLVDLDRALDKLSSACPSDTVLIELKERLPSLIKDFDQHSRNVKDGSKVMESFSNLSSKTKQGLDKASQLESHRDSLVQAKESKEQELRLLQKQIEKLSKELEGVENQLAVLEDDCGLLKQELDIASNAFSATANSRGPSSDSSSRGYLGFN